MLRLITLLSTLLLAACATSSASPQGQPPERQIFVSAAHPLATEAGLVVLRRGGSAVDAAIAVQAMLSLVEPQSSGLGGGAFMTRFDATTGTVTVYDGRETAPAGVTADMFLDDLGEPLPRPVAMTSGRATGVPGVVRMLALAHAEHGRLPWQQLFGDAQRTAREGFIVTDRLGRFIGGDFVQASAPDVRAYFTKSDGRLVAAGDRLRNPAYAEFLGRLAAEGPGALYRGPTAQRIVARTRVGPLGGTMTLADLDFYQPVRREPLCGTFRVTLICVPPPPSSGVGLLQLLAILERTDIADRGPADPQAWFLFAEASRIMYSDRDHYVADPAFVHVPVEGLLDPSYVALRARLIGERAGPQPEPGHPPGASAVPADRTLEPAGTSHFVIVDAQGNTVSMTTTVESYFGSGRMVDGFFLNNQMTDFSFSPGEVNSVAPGKRPRSSMAPLVMLRNGRLVGALGSPGGSAILAYVAKALVGTLDWGLSMEEAIALPNLFARSASFNGERAKMPPQLLAGLAARGIDVEAGSGEDSGLHGFIVTVGGHFDGGADPRRDGVARAERIPVAKGSE